MNIHESECDHLLRSPLHFAIETTHKPDLLSPTQPAAVVPVPQPVCCLQGKLIVIGFFSPSREKEDKKEAKSARRIAVWKGGGVLPPFFYFPPLLELEVWACAFGATSHAPALTPLTRHLHKAGKLYSAHSLTWPAWHAPLPPFPKKKKKKKRKEGLLRIQ